MLPHTSTIMMRRNSAMERAAANNSSNSGAAGIGNPTSTSIATSSVSTPSSIKPVTPISPHNVGISGSGANCTSSGGATTTTTAIVTPNNSGNEIAAAQGVAIPQPHPRYKQNSPTIVPPPPPPAVRRTSTNTSPRFSPGETTPKLPPKPRFSGNCYNNPGKFKKKKELNVDII